MRIDLLIVPYDSGQLGRRCGAGPLALIEAGLPARLEALNFETAQHLVIAPDAFPCEAGTGMQIAAQLSKRVRRSLDEDAFPLVLAGNCMSAVGTVAGAEAEGVLWCDAHADLNTAETSMSGFVDGMALATVIGRAWTALAGNIPDFHPIAADRVVLFGGRDFDPPEQNFIEERAIPVTGPQTVVGALRSLAPRADRTYLHLDMDVFNSSEFRANPYAVPGGPDAEEVRQMMTDAARIIAPLALAVTSYDPACDPERVGARAAIAALETFFRERF